MAPDCSDRPPGGQNVSVQRILGLVGVCRSTVGDLVGLPARQLASFMDDVDEVWLLDPFLDQPDGVERCG